MSTKGTPPLPRAYSIPCNFRYPQGLIEVSSLGKHTLECTEITASQLHATSTDADESNAVKVGIGGDDGHDEHKDGE